MNASISWFALYSDKQPENENQLIHWGWWIGVAEDSLADYCKRAVDLDLFLHQLRTIGSAAILGSRDTEEDTDGNETD